jgi:hypothetical protein
LREISDAVGAFIFEFAGAAGSVVLPAMEPACVLLPREDLAADLPADVSESFQPIPIASGAELIEALKGGYDSWRAFRDRVVRESSDPSGGIDSHSGVG